jgi:tetratricopeptide (TPR) repeat protein
MSISIGENYLLKAKDAYHYDMETCVEALNYAMSYEDENAEVWLLHGKVMLYYIKDYSSAEESFLNALSVDPTHSETFIEFIWLRINEARFLEAQQLLYKALQVVKKDFAQLFRLQAVLLEYEESYAEAIESLEIALEKTYNCSYQCFLEEEVKRLKNKKKRNAKKTKKKKVFVKHYTSDYSLS